MRDTHSAELPNGDKNNQEEERAPEQPNDGKKQETGSDKENGKAKEVNEVAEVVEEKQCDTDPDSAAGANPKPKCIRAVSGASPVLPSGSVSDNQPSEADQGSTDQASSSTANPATLGAFIRQMNTASCCFDDFFMETKMVELKIKTAALSRAPEEAKRAKAETAKLQAELKTALNRSAQQEKRIASLKTNIDKEKKITTGVKTENERLKKAAINVKTENASLKKQLKESSLAELKEKLTEANRARDAAITELKQLESETEKARLANSTANATLPPLGSCSTEELVRLLNCHKASLASLRRQVSEARAHGTQHGEAVGFEMLLRIENMVQAITNQMIAEIESRLSQQGQKGRGNGKENGKGKD